MRLRGPLKNECCTDATFFKADWPWIGSITPFLVLKRTGCFESEKKGEGYLVGCVCLPFYD